MKLLMNKLLWKFQKISLKNKLDIQILKYLNVLHKFFHQMDKKRDAGIN